MPLVSQMLPSKFLKMAEGDPSKFIIIRGVKLETVSKDNEPKKERWTLLSADNKPVVLNSTNLKRLAKALGNDSDAWVGKTVEVYFDPDIEFGGEIVGGIRVRVPKQDATGTSQAPPKSASDFDDAIPF